MDRTSPLSDLPARFRTWGGVMNVSDLFIVLANWGPCPIAALGTIVASHEQTVNDSGLHMDGWDAFMTVMEGLDTSKQDNWNCWMQNYLSGCTRCPACPSSDPLAPYRLD